ncbi:MAG: xanthine dehydrogenase molybdenum-binding subunit XdhA, partial [Lachnospiraceae bacterium]|nr:xanthine dehydrogenase molybdenum-binding subunit XdhA [Candidatus Equihabitans merdae]
MSYKVVGKPYIRLDAHDKAIGRTKYTDDLCDRGALIAKVLHSPVAHGIVKSIDKSEAEKIPGVVAVYTCFDLKEKHLYPTAGHPWSMDPHHQDHADRLLMTDHPRYHGDDIGAVVAEDEVAAAQAIRALEKNMVIEELPFVLDAREAMKDGAPQIHEHWKNNIIGHTDMHIGDTAKAIAEEKDLIKVETWCKTPTVQHCHIENFLCYAYGEGDGRTVIVASTQIPHIVRRVVGQATGLPWGKFRVIKPYVGGGFGNKQDVLYEPLCAWLSIQLGGRLVKLECSREETFICNRVRHAVEFHMTSWVRPDGTFAARKCEIWSDQGGYVSHGHSIAAKEAGAFPQLYPCDNIDCEAWTVHTNKPAAGAMRGYGMPQASFAWEIHTEEIAEKIGMQPLEFRRKNLMPVGYVHAFSKNELYEDSINQCFDKGAAFIDYYKKYEEYKNQPKGDIRRGIAVSTYWYNTAIYPISLETSSCRMVMNQDGSIQVQIAENEIGQGADTVCAQMAAETLGVTMDKVHVVSCQDTDITPFGTGVYASRGTFVMSFSIRQTALMLKERILKYAHEYVRMPVFNMDIVDNWIIRTTDGRRLMSLEELSSTAIYHMTNSQHMTAESTYTIKSNALSLGACFAEVEVDIPMCRVQLLNIINVHDCGTVINPALAEAQVHGGMSMGIGYALSEKLMWDEKTGRALNNNLLDYKLSSFMDHPRL